MFSLLYNEVYFVLLNNDIYRQEKSLLEGQVVVTKEWLLAVEQRLATTQHRYKDEVKALQIELVTKQEHL